MNIENTKQPGNEDNAIEDLTLNEAEAEDVKGGVALVFSFAQGGLKGAIEAEN